MFQTSIASQIIENPIEEFRSIDDSKNHELSEYELDYPAIYISHDYSFDYRGFLGNGTSENPYIIEDIYINSSYKYGIVITRTTRHFIIRNCTFDSQYGLNLIDVLTLTAKVINNTFRDNVIGLYLFKSEGTQIKDNHFYNCGLRVSDYWDNPVASLYVENNFVNNKKLLYLKHTNNLNLSHDLYGQIYLYNCENISFENLIIANTHTAISIYNSEMIRVRNCSFYNNNFGGILLEGSSNTVENCTFKSNLDFGIALEGSGGNILNNTFVDDGIYSKNLSDKWMIENNTVNSKSIGVFNDITNLELITSDYGQVFLQKCTDVTIKDQNLSNTTIGLVIVNSFDLVIENISCSNNDKYGIYIYNSENCSIDNSDFNNNLEEGIYINICPKLTISNSEFNYNRNGFYSLAFNFEYLNSNTTIINSKFDENSFCGLVLQYSIFGILANNSLSFNNYTGLVIETSYNYLIQNNTISSNEMGIWANHCGVYKSGEWNDISFNTFKDNLKAGIYLFWSARRNVIHHNNFINNNLYRSYQAVDNSEPKINIWYHKGTRQGNYWNDFVGRGNYKIGGRVGAVDKFPLSSYASFTEYQWRIEISSVTSNGLVSLVLFAVVFLKRKRKS